MAIIITDIIKNKIQTAYNSTFNTSISNPNITLATSNNIYGTIPAASTFTSEVDKIPVGTCIKISHIVNAVKPFLNKLAKMRSYQIYTYRTTAVYNVNGIVTIATAGSGITCLNDSYTNRSYELTNNNNTQKITINYLNYNSISGFPQQDQRVDIENNGYEDTEKIMIQGLTDYFNKIVNTFKMNMQNPSVIFMTTTCHSNCHSSCHSSRGRR